MEVDRWSMHELNDDDEENEDMFKAKGGKKATKRTKSVSVLSRGMDEVEESLEKRGLKFLKREDSEQKPKQKAIVKEDEDKTEINLFETLSKNGFVWSVSNIFPNQSLEQAVEELKKPIERRWPLFVFALRHNNKLAEAKLIQVDVSKGVVDYIGGEVILESRKLIGSRIAADLIAKDKFHVWFKGDNQPTQHTTFYEEYRQLAIDSLKIRAAPPFSFICVHEGVLKKRGKSGWTHNVRYVRLVCGQAIIYRKSTSFLPLDAFGLLGVQVLPKSSKSIEVLGKHRSYVFKCDSEKERDKWLAAFKLATERCKYERELLSNHLAMLKAKLQKRRGKQMLQSMTQPQLAQVNEFNEQKSDQPLRVSNMQALEQKVLEIPAKPMGHYDGGSAEFEVKLIGFDNVALPVGFVQIASNCSLDAFRPLILAQLPSVSQDFVFLRDGVPVRKEQEPIRMAIHVVRDDVVTLRVSQILQKSQDSFAKQEVRKKVKEEEAPPPPVRAESGIEPIHEEDEEAPPSKEELEQRELQKKLDQMQAEMDSVMELKELLGGSAKPKPPVVSAPKPVDQPALQPAAKASLGQIQLPERQKK